MSDNNELKFSWLPKSDKVGERLFTFDGKQIFNLFRDYPHALNPEQKEYLMKKIHFGLIFSKTGNTRIIVMIEV